MYTYFVVYMFCLGFFRSLRKSLSVEPSMADAVFSPLSCSLPNEFPPTTSAPLCGLCDTSHIANAVWNCVQCEVCAILFPFSISKRFLYLTSDKKNPKLSVLLCFCRPSRKLNLFYCQVIPICSSLAVKGPSEALSFFVHTRQVPYLISISCSYRLATDNMLIWQSYGRPSAPVWTGNNASTCHPRAPWSPCLLTVYDFVLFLGFLLSVLFCQVPSSARGAGASQAAICVDEWRWPDKWLSRCDVQTTRGRSCVALLWSVSIYSLNFTPVYLCHCL